MNRNIGMGHQFLKHVERTRLNLLIVDIFGFQLSQKHMRRSCLENVYSLNKELELYNETLLEKPSILLVNKMDLEGSIEIFTKNEKYFNDLRLAVNQMPEEIRPEKLLKFERVIPISAKCRKEIDVVKEEIREVIDLIDKRNHIERSDELINERLRRKLMEHSQKIV